MSESKKGGMKTIQTAFMNGLRIDLLFNKFKNDGVVDFGSNID